MWFPALKHRGNWWAISWQGQRAIVGYQREGWAVPEIGEVYKLTTPDEQTSQFIRITAVDHSVATFTYHNGSEYVDFNRRQVEMEISAPLITTFTGSQPVPGEPEEETSTIYGTQIADTSRCFLLREWHPAQKIIWLEYPGSAVNVGIDSTEENKLLEALKMQA